MLKKTKIWKRKTCDFSNSTGFLLIHYSVLSFIKIWAFYASKKLVTYRLVWFTVLPLSQR